MKDSNRRAAGNRERRERLQNWRRDRKFIALSEIRTTFKSCIKFCDDDGGAAALGCVIYILGYRDSSMWAWEIDCSDIQIF